MSTYLPAPPLAQPSVAGAPRYTTSEPGLVFVKQFIFRGFKETSLADGYAALAEDEEFADSRRDARARQAARPPRSALDD